MAIRSLSIICAFVTCSVYSETSITIPDIIVTPTSQIITKINRSENAVTLSMVDSDKTAQTFNDVMQGLLGVQLNDLYGDGTQMSLSIRGFGDNASANSLILVNGMPQIQPDLSAFNFNNIPIENIQTIQILPDSASVLYGDQAIGGVINIITTPINQETSSLNLYAGSFDTANVGIGHSNRLSSNTSYALSGQLYHSDNYRDHNAVNHVSVNGNLYYAAGDENMTLSYNSFYQTQQFPGALTRKELDMDRAQSQFGDDSYGDEWDNNVSLQFNRNLSSLWQFKLLSNLDDYNGWGELNNTLIPNTESDFEQNKLTSFINPIFTRALLNDGQLTLGGSTINDAYQFDSGYQNTDDTIKDYRNQNALYSYLTTYISQKTMLNVGLRAANFTDNFKDMPNNTGHALVSEEGITYRESQQTKVYIKRAGSYRFPKVDEEVNYTETGEQVLNPLKPQTGVSYTLGIAKTIQKNKFNANVYYLKLNNEIEYIPTAQSSDIYNNENITQTKRLGLMLSDIYKVKKHYTLLTSINVVNPKITDGQFSGSDIPDVPEVTYKFRLNATLSERATTYIEDVYTGQMYAAGDTENLAGEQGGYSVFNIGVNMQLKKQLVFYVKAKNIFNKEYNVYTVYNPSTGLSYYPAAGVSFYAGIKYAA